MTMQFNTLREWLDWQEGLHPQPIDLGLERVTSVFKCILPQGITVPVITVAGTNGKGSSVALLEAIYCAQGYRVGAYTSPHIIKYNERIRINGEPVADELITLAFSRIETSRGDISLSYFEFGTLAALDVFCHADLDILLLEVGLGGRLDAVNIVDPDVALISSIDIDHAEWLGNTREQIALEKAGIFRADKPAIIGDPIPPDTLFSAAEARGSRLFCLGREFNYQRYADYWTWQCGSLMYAKLPFPALKGEHQFRNASAVLAAIAQLQKLLPVTESAVCSGLANVMLKGRFQLINAVVPVLLDVGHNPQAVQTLFDYVKEVFPDLHIHALFAMMKDKDIKQAINIMSPLIDSWTIVPLANPRAASSALMLELFAAAGISNVSANFDSFKAAVKHAVQQVKPGELILVFGSFFLVSAFLAEFEEAGAMDMFMRQIGLNDNLPESENSGRQILMHAQEICAVEVPCR